MELLNATAIERPAANKVQAGAVDAGTSRDGKFYDQVWGGEGAVTACAVGEDGALPPVKGGELAGLPASAGIQGFAAR